MASTVIGDIGGRIRLRTALTGVDVLDPNIDPRLLTFDSAWTSALRLLHSNVVSAAALGTANISYGYSGSIPGGMQTGTRAVRVLSYPGAHGPYHPTLAWMRNGAGTLSYIPAGGSLSGPSPLGYQRGYGVCAVNLRDNEIYFSPSRDGVDYVYFIFATNPTAAEAGGPEDGLIGFHDLYGTGLYLPRPGLNVMTASLDDMTLTTRRNHFQIYESGTAYTTPGPVGSPGVADGDFIGDDPFPTAISTLRRCKIVNLRGYYPHYPPVIAAHADMGATWSRFSPSVFWLNPSQILVAGMNERSVGIRYAVVASDPAYQYGVGPIVTRIHMDEDVLLITKHGIDMDAVSSDADYIFSSRRQSPRFTGFDQIPAGASSGTYWLPSAGVAPAGAGPPFTFMMASDGLSNSGWWCGMGHVIMQDIANSNPVLYGNYYGPYFAGCVISRDQYKWYQNAGYPTLPIGYVSTMNISDY